VQFKGAKSDLDLSEEWLSYVASHNKSTEGSYSKDNMNYLAYYGSVEQALLPYEGDVWKSVNASPLSEQRCGNVPSSMVTGCLVSHWDPRYLDMDDATLKAQNPQFFDVRNRARQFRVDYLASSLDWHTTDYEVKTTGDIKRLLAAGEPLTADFHFYYGAWNHGLGVSYGLKRDLDAWNHGVIGYPEPGSLDRYVSEQHPEGHSVEIVGYDDDVVVNTTVQMRDGTTRSFSYKGVYYFKNSWGTGSFGSQLTINGVPHPGYGMITQKYAHEQGSFYRLPVH
jgi:hypothetical protein